MIDSGVDRRHQVFISSTFRDLIDERREVIEALLEMDAIPAGMELFAAGDTDQWTLIQQVIDQSDYYIVIVGGRYGSLTAEGISYTEKEYDYAVARGVPVMGFVHRDPNLIPVGKSDVDPETSKKLDAFREKVKQKIVREYSSPQDLGGVVSRGLHKLQRDSPRPGWVRGDLAMTPQAQSRMAEMRAEIAELRQAASERQASSEGRPKIEGLASGDDSFELEMEITATQKKDKDVSQYSRPSYLWTVGYKTTWNEILHAVGPSLMDEGSVKEITEALDNLGLDLMREQTDRWPTGILHASKREISESSVADVLVHLFALDLIAHGSKRRTSSDRNTYWALTPAGENQVMFLRAVRRPTPEERFAERRLELQAMTVPELRAVARDLHHLPARGVKAELVDAVLEAELTA